MFHLQFNIEVEVKNRVNSFDKIKDYLTIYFEEKRIFLEDYENKLFFQRKPMLGTHSGDNLFGSIHLYSSGKIELIELEEKLSIKVWVEVWNLLFIAISAAFLISLILAILIDLNWMWFWGSFVITLTILLILGRLKIKSQITKLVRWSLA